MDSIHLLWINGCSKFTLFKTASTPRLTITSKYQLPAQFYRLMADFQVTQLKHLQGRPLYKVGCGQILGASAVSCRPGK